MLVGRETELHHLQGWWQQALAGHRQVVFVTGEPGIGKTAVVEAFVARVVHPHGLWVGMGQCIEHFGAGEAYLPVLTALGQLCREPGGIRLIDLLLQHAPSWLLQLPALLSTAELEALQRRTAGATRERMLRELAEALEVLTTEHPLVLVLEDLHWSDHATLDWLAFVARRHQPARVLVISTYRSVEVILREHPLKSVKQELQLHGQCQELVLELLPEGAVREYLVQRFPEYQVPASCVRVLYQRTEGNPLFMVTLVEELLARGLLALAGEKLTLWHEEQMAREVPENLRQMIEQQIERSSPEEQRALEAASAAGAEFSAAGVAAGVEAAVEAVEERCAELTRRGQFLRAKGTAEWPDGTVAARYEFLHALYQEVTYERVPAGRRAHLHQRIGERAEGAYGARAEEIAAELAVHFERGRDYRRAVRYLGQAARNAIQRSANQEAIHHLTRGLELLQTLPDTLERAQQELALQIILGAALMAAKGYAASEVEKAYIRARELCQQVGETSQLFLILWGLWGVHYVRADLQTAYELAEDLLELAQHEQEPVFAEAETRFGLGGPLLYLGQGAAARAHLERGIALYDPQQHRSLAFLYGVNPGVFCQSYMAWTLWWLGYPEQALKRAHEALTLAQEQAHPLSLATALYYAAWLHQSLREVQVAQEQAEAEITLCTEQGFAYWLPLGTILRGWALAEQGKGEEGIMQMRQGLAAYWAIGAELVQTYCLALLAEAYGRTGQAEEGLSVLAEALARVDKTGERLYEAELYRLKGELSLKSRQVKTSQDKSKQVGSPDSEAEECFRRAIEIARRQQAKSLELRAVMSLVRLWQQQGKKKQAL